MDVIKQVQVIGIMYYSLELTTGTGVLVFCKPALPETNDLQQSPASCIGRENIFITVVAQLRQMDSHNPPHTGGEGGFFL